MLLSELHNKIQINSSIPLLGKKYTYSDLIIYIFLYYFSTTKYMLLPIKKRGYLNQTIYHKIFDNTIISMKYENLCYINQNKDAAIYGIMYSYK